MTDRTHEFHDLVHASETQAPAAVSPFARTDTPPSDVSALFAASVAQTTHTLDRTAAAVARFSERLLMLKLLFSFRFLSHISPLDTHTVAKTTSLFEERRAGPEAQRLAGEIQQSLVALAGRLDALETRCGAPRTRVHTHTSSIDEHRAAVIAYLRLRTATLSDDYRTALQTRTAVCSF